MKSEGIYETVNRKRENIIKNARVEEVAPPEYEEAVERMEDYLRSQKKRCTIERRYVLEILYRYNWPVDITALHEKVCEVFGNVALTTVYNTLDLLVKLQLARRIELVSHGMAFFERRLGVEPHGYVVCEECASLRYLRLANVQTLIQPQMPKGFDAQDYTVLVHGLCSKCQRARQRRKRKQVNTTEK